MGKIVNSIRKALDIDSEARRHQNINAIREQHTKAPFEPFFEEEPTVGGWLRLHSPTRHDVLPFLASFFPFTSWLGRYNTRWLLADVIAAMAYALLVGLSPEYGLYTSFTGAALYWLFGTSKDVAIGATAVVSLLVGKTVDEVLAARPDEHYTREQVAKTHAFLAGCVLLVFGLLRLDWLIEFIPHVAIAAFVTGAALVITLSQVPALLGIEGQVETKVAAYRVFVDSCRALPQTKLDAAVGISGLVLLALIKWYCDRMAKRDPKRVRMWNMFCALRLSVTILLFTLVSFLVHRKVPFEDSKFQILGPLPRGFIRTGPPSFDPKLVTAILPQLPPTVIILLIEHIAIGKSFGRINDYMVVPSQELMSIAFTNLTGPFVGAYASTGSFSGTAILSKAEVRTPLAGVFNGVVLVLALYALTSVLYYIPLASLSALIIHAVYNLITPPAELVRMWRAAPPDVVLYFVGVLVSVFDSLEDGIYITVALSLALLLLRIAKASGQFLGRVTVYPYYHHPVPRGDDDSSGTVVEVNDGLGKKNDLVETELKVSTPTEDQKPTSSSKIVVPGISPVHKAKYGEDDVPSLPSARDIYFRLDGLEAINPEVAIVSPCPGVFIYRFPNGLSYLNQAQLLDALTTHIMSHTRRTTVPEYAHPGLTIPPAHRIAPGTTLPHPHQTKTKPLRPPHDNSSGSLSYSSSTAMATDSLLPTLRAVVLDCATVHHTDSSAVEGLADIRGHLGRWAAPDPVEWHFANLRNRWTRKAFTAVGFGCCDYCSSDSGATTTSQRPGFSLAARYGSEASGGGGVGAAVATAVPPAVQRRSNGEEDPSGSETEVASRDDEDVENKPKSSDTTHCTHDERWRLSPVTGMDKPFFHLDLAAAVEAASRHAVRGHGVRIVNTVRRVDQPTAKDHERQKKRADAEAALDVALRDSPSDRDHQAYNKPGTAAEEEHEGVDALDEGDAPAERAALLGGKGSASRAAS
ncbi:sulfate permease [Apiospora hydei]|uniref:Sulfate permease n=1 Tax=Apiospora hydei TaxID=1337664 RepID=A0ABR1WPW4_9PEZI